MCKVLKQRGWPCFLQESGFSERSKTLNMLTFPLVCAITHTDKQTLNLRFEREREGGRERERERVCVFQFMRFDRLSET